MDPQQTPETRNLAEASMESEQESSTSSEQAVNATSPEIQSLTVETPRGPSQRAVPLTESRPLQAPMPVARQTSDQPYGNTERAGYEAVAPSSPHWGEGPHRYPMLRIGSTERVQGRPRTGDSARRSTYYNDPNRYPGIPVEQTGSPSPRTTVRDRLKLLVDEAKKKRDWCNKTANGAKWGINFVAGISVFLGAMTTGVSAIRLNGKNLGIATTVLGILSTLAGAFLTKVRAEKEPEQSIRLADRLNTFIRKCEDFIIDFGDEDGHKAVFDKKVNDLRLEYNGISGSNSSSVFDVNPNSKDPEKEKDNAKDKAKEKLPAQLV